MRRLQAFWQGDLPLGDAFWTWTITIGLVVNVSSKILFLTLLSLDRPWEALFVGYALPLPYNIVAVVGVLRSAARYQGPELHADLARWSSVMIMAVLSVF